MTKFFDTCSLLDEHQDAIKNGGFLISSITLKELENIKTSSSKDPEVKYKARKLLHLLAENRDKYEVIQYIQDWDADIHNLPTLSLIDDSRIMVSALRVAETRPITFYTKDLSCAFLANSIGLNVDYLSDVDKSDYTGFKDMSFNDEELSDFYMKLGDCNDNFLDMNINQYLIIRDKNNYIIDRYKWTEEGFKQVNFLTFNSKMFGTVKPKDDYQRAAMDSLASNRITMLRGAAGTGKSYLSFGYLFSELERGRIDKIIIFCNTVATAGAAKLGYYPGSRDEKLLDSQIGNLLASKLGDKIAVERLIEDGTLVLLPLSDIRGYDTTGMKAGIYISEAQNLDIELMRLALQRVGEDSICILDGDSDAQVDLSIYAGNNNGMRRVSEIFRNHDIYGEVTLQNIYRSKIAALAQLM